MTTPSPEPSGPAESDTAPIAPAPPPPPPAPPPPSPVRPPSNVGWAVTALIIFWPLAFSAFTHALNVFPLWTEGNTEAARYASDRARWLGILSLWIGGALLVIFAILYLILLIVLVHHGHHHHMHRIYQPYRPMGARGSSR